MSSRHINVSDINSVRKIMITTLTKGQVPLPIEHEIRTRLEDGDGDTFLHIVPTDHARLKWHRDYLRNSPNRAVTGLHIYSLEYFVRLLYSRLNTRRRRIGAGIQTVWTHEIMEGEELPFLRPNPEASVPPGIATRLREAVNQLKTGGVDWQQLQDTPAASDADSPDKLSDLITFYKAYEKRLGSRWVDRAGVHRTVSEQFTRNPRRAARLIQTLFHSVDLVVVSGFDVLSPFDLAILTGIADLPSVNMGVVLDFDEENDSLFGHVKADYVDRFLSCGFERHDAEIETPDAAPIGSGFKATRNLHLARNLFRTDRGQEPAIEKLALTDQISLLYPSNRVKEVEEIARLIKRLALSESSPALDEICVTFYGLDVYAPLIREIFPLHGIPYSLEWSDRLENSTVVIAIFSLLEYIQGSASLQAQKQVHRSPYFQIDDWDSMIGNCDLNTELSPEAFRERFDRLMDTLKGRQQILQGSWESKTRIARYKVNAYRQFRRLINELVDFLITNAGVEVRYPLQRYITWLRLMTSQAVYQWGDPNDGGVRILPLIQTKDLSFDTVILGGLVDGEFPSVFRSDTFLPAQRRGTESDRLREDRSLFYQALTLYHRELYLLSPQYDGDIELTPSAFIDELQRVSKINTPMDDDGTLFGTENFLKNYGVYVWERAETEQVEAPVVPSAMSPMLDLVAHNICVEKSRTSTNELPQYAGNLLPHLLSERSRQALERRREWTYSVTHLEAYGECPFRYFSDSVLRLKRIEEEEPGLTSMEKGSLAHKILFEFYDSRRDASPISGCSDGEFKEALKDLQRIARTRVAEEAARRHLNRAERLFWDIEAERLIGSHGRAGIFATFLQAERERKLEVQPRHFEVGFGLSDGSGPTDPHLGSNEAIVVGEISLSGKIDRVELGNGMFVIGDYKTGSSTPKLNDILEGRSLQLPLYIAVVEQLLEQQSASIQGAEAGVESARGVGGVYYVLQEESGVALGIGDKDYNGRAFQVSRSGQLLSNSKGQAEDIADSDDSNAIDPVIDVAIGYANRYVRSIVDGDFQLTRHDKTKVCRYCSFKRICRVGVIAEDTYA